MIVTIFLRIWLSVHISLRTVPNHKLLRIIVAVQKEMNNVSTVHRVSKDSAYDRE